MTTWIYSHPACIDHDPGMGHPESGARLKSVIKALKADAFGDLAWQEAPMATEDQVTLVHVPEFVSRLLEAVPERGRVAIDLDTQMSPASGEAALRAVGAVCAGVDAVMGGKADNAFCAVRPPGHHAEPARAMGFCLFNSVAIGAYYARATHGAERVAVVDFDVHHGNGTEAAFRHDPALFFASTHQGGIYPGTGGRNDQGVGNIFNEPLPAGAGTAEFQRAMGDRILPALADFDPDLVIISAGFDAHREDPLAGLAFVEEDYAWATREILAIAQQCCQGRVVSSLEGGYDLSALGRSAAAHVAVLSGGA